MKRNAYMLKGKLKKEGYDWWWHSFTAYNSVTKKPKSFFIEYFIINPALGGKKPIFGQTKDNKIKNIKPSYAMIKAGTWGEEKAQIHNFYATDNFFGDYNLMKVYIGDNYADDNRLYGSVELTDKRSKMHPEYMSDSGYMSWDLKLEKILSYNVGFGASKIMRALNAFEMYWHIEGMYTEYEGEIIYNKERYDVIKGKSFGYQDKNWGRKFTNPWIWLNCNNFKSLVTKEKLKLTSLDVGGGCPVLFKIKIPKKVIIAFFYKGELYEYNFSKPLDKVKQNLDCKVDEKFIKWNIKATNKYSKIEINFSCNKNHMVKVNYESPKGLKKHNQLYNGGNAKGKVKLYKKKGNEYVLIDKLYGENAGCEYGKY